MGLVKSNQRPCMIMGISNKAFWICQISAWSFLALINLLVQFLGDNFNFWQELGGSLLFMVMGVGYTTLLRHAIRKLKLITWRPWLLIIPVLLLSLVTTALIIATSLSLLEFYFNLQGTPQNLINFKTILGNTIGIYPLIVTWCVLYFAIHYFIQWRQVEVDKVRLESALKVAQLNTLIGQINPHFMFNSLNNIRALMLEDTHKARDSLTKLSLVLRYALTADNHQFIPLREELSAVAHYLDLAKIQYEDKLVVEQQVDESLFDCIIPPMMVQMLVENAIKHGIANQKKGGLLQLHISKGQNQLCIQVANPGQLQQRVNDFQSTGIGVKNIADRLQLLYGPQAIFTLSQQEERVCAMLKIPAEIHHESYHS